MNQENLSPEQIILQWKEMYGEVFSTQVGEHDFYFRLLTYNEYSTIKEKAQDEVEADEMICSLCVIDPTIEDWSEQIFAGYTDTLARLIKEESLIISKANGEGDVRDMIEQGMEEIESSFMMQLPVIIAKAFPQYRIEELEKFTLRKQIDLYVKAAWAIKQFDDIDLEFKDDEEE